MAFRVPAMPLTVNIWRNGSVVANPPDVVSRACLSLGERGMVAPLNTIGNSPAAGTWEQTMMRSMTLPVELLLPKGTDIRSYVDPNPAGDCVEAPAGSGRFYAVVFVDDVAKGFPNEYRLALALQLTPLYAVYTGNPWSAPNQAWPLP